MLVNCEDVYLHRSLRVFCLFPSIHIFYSQFMFCSQLMEWQIDGMVTKQTNKYFDLNEFWNAYLIGYNSPLLYT